MRIFADKSIRRLFAAITAVLIIAAALVQAAAYYLCGRFSLLLLGVSVMAGCAVIALTLLYFKRQDSRLEAAAAEIDKTVYIKVIPASGMAGSSVPVTLDIRTDYRVDTMTLLLKYDNGLKPVPADPAEPDIPKAEIDQRRTPDAAPRRSLFEFSDRPSQSMLVIASTQSFQRCRITVWFDVPADAAVGKKSTSTRSSLYYRPFWTK